MRKKVLTIGLMTMMAISMAGCGAGTQSTTEVQEGTTEATTAASYEKVTIKEPSKVDQTGKPEAGETIAVMKIKDYGDIKIKFFNQEAPKAVENFLTLAANGYYDGITFHRVINDFMIQGGDPTGTGAGGESIWGTEFENENSDKLLPIRGALCMANAGPDTNGSQFFIEQAKTVDQSLLDAAAQQGVELTDSQKKEFIKNGGSPWLTGGYTVFGQVYEGMEVVDEIAKTETDGSDKPTKDVVIESIEVTEYK